MRRRPSRIAVSFDSISPVAIPAVDEQYQADDASRDIKKAPDLDDDLRPYYEFDYSKMKPNRFAGEKKIYKRSTIPKKALRKISRDPK
jgi:hypothetical protein